jgi:hypothetical protein
MTQSSHAAPARYADLADQKPNAHKPSPLIVGITSRSR